MDEQDIEHFRALLIQQREDILALRDTRDQSRQTVELDQSRVGRLSRMDAMQQQAMAQAGQRQAELLLKKIHAALKRCEDGSFGDCFDCGEPIPPKRLESDPSALRCVRCAEGAE